MIIDFNETSAFYVLKYDNNIDQSIYFETSASF